MVARTLKTAGITGVGMSFPEKRLTNADLEKMVDTKDEWIVERTGIRERRIVAKRTGASVHGAKAAEQALEHAGLAPSKLMNSDAGVYMGICANEYQAHAIADAKAEILAMRFRDNEDGRWTMEDVSCHESLAAALVIEGRLAQLSLWRSPLLPETLISV